MPTRYDANPHYICDFVLSEQKQSPWILLTDSNLSALHRQRGNYIMGKFIIEQINSLKIYNRILHFKGNKAANNVMLDKSQRQQRKEHVKSQCRLWSIK